MAKFLIAYDISDSAARTKIADRLEKLGSRVQRSVFVLKCGEEKLEKLEQELQKILSDTDSLLILPLCRHCFDAGRIYGNAIPELILL